MRQVYRSGLLPLVFRGILLTLALVVMVDGASAASLSGRASDRRAAKKQEDERNAEVPLTVDSFSHTLTLDGEAGAVLSCTLSENVHLALRQPNFSDLCVFDADGTPVPFQLLSPQGKNAELAVEKDLPHFLWQPEKPEAKTPGTMDIEIDANGGIVRIKGDTGDLARSGPASYLLDMQAFYDAAAAPSGPGGEKFTEKDTKERILIAHLGGDEPIMASVSMKTSADLTTWTGVGKPQMLVRARQGEIAMERNALTLPSRTGRYLLLQFPDGDIPVASFSAKAQFDKTTYEVRESILHGSLSENKRVVSYSLPGRFPIKAVGFDLPQADMMAVRLTGANDPERPYSLVADGFIYRLEKDGAMLTGEPFPTGYSYHYWKLNAAGEIPFAMVPGMRVYWMPRELLFLARGKGPWTLAYGRAAPVQASGLPLLAHGDVKSAREIAASTPAGDGAIQTPRDGKPEGSRAWVLWAVLVLSVVFLTGVTVWLVRSMKR